MQHKSIAIYNSSDEIEHTFYGKITHAFSQFALAFVIPLGLLLNTVSMFLFSGKKLQKVRFYYIIILVAGCLILSTNGLDYYLNSVEKQVFLLKELWCKIAPYLSRVFLQSSLWLNFLFSFDRMISVTHPSKHLALKNKMALVKVLLLMCSIILLVNSPVAVPKQNKSDHESKFCAERVHSFMFLNDSILQIALILLPTVLMFLTNAILIMGFKVSKQV